MRLLRVPIRLYMFGEHAKPRSLEGRKRMADRKYRIILEVEHEWDEEAPQFQLDMFWDQVLGKIQLLWGHFFNKRRFKVSYKREE